MGGRSGGGAGPGKGDFNYKGKISNIESLKNIQDRQLYNEMKSAISRFHAALGIQEKNIKLADLNGAYGVHVTAAGKSEAIYLNKSYYKTGTKKSITEQKQKDYASGWATKTNKAVAHTITHELAHATWNTALTGTNQRAAGVQIQKLYKSWSRDRKKSGYGKYSKSNVNEFWAETVTKGIHGKSDKYTKAAFSIARKYKL